ncbi:ATP-binding protein [Vagococcus penaei]|uniref:histidine kinase n=1 Tax=Vagococcus penaei TaxID=633807 RepID=A0A1Q2D4Q6_9ENTE|nr:ATP-binding protein [Vagococcus penaei]AQP53380.1 histidine kinase [Vagococcus penaei]
MLLIKNKKSRFSLQATIILIVVCSTLVSLIASMFLIRHYVVEQEYRHTKDKISVVADIVAQEDGIVQALENRESTVDVQALTMGITDITQVDFVVVVDTDMLRLSHPDANVIGKPFSNPADIQEALDGKKHFSIKKGILGEGIRYFVPVYSSSGEIIGVVCVGLTMKTINLDIKNAQNTIFIGILLGLTVGVIGAIFLAKKIKKVLFGLEPIEIAEAMREKELVENEITESIIAIDQQKRLMLINKEAYQLVAKIDDTLQLKIKEPIPTVLYDLFFSEVFIQQDRLMNQTISANSLDLIANMSPIYAENEFNGAVVTFRDESDMSQLIHQLSGTEQYIDSLRAQTHEFMNKMQVIMGMIELGQYQEVSVFIQHLHSNYKAEVGYITDKIKTPAIAGFLLGKVNEANEQGIKFIINDKSFLPNLPIDDNSHFLLQILGNIINNAFDAVKGVELKEVTLLLTYDNEGEIVMMSVTDTGPGIAKEIQDKIFEKKFSTKAEQRGYGLYLVKKSVTARDGIIDVSIDDTGRTHFYVEFPIIKGSEDTK